MDSHADGLSHATLKALCRRSDASGIRHLTGHLLALAASGALVGWTARTAWLWPAMLLHGTLLVFLFAPLHECIHFTAFRRRWLNAAVAWMAGAVVCLPPGYFRLFHLRHHRFTQDPVRDPELSAAKPEGISRYLWYLSGVPYWRERLATTLRHASGQVKEEWIPARRVRETIVEARFLWGIYTLVAVMSVAWQTSAALLLWLLPVLLAQPLLRAFLLAEHVDCPYTDDMLANSRTTHTLALVRGLSWNMCYHAEHHACPALPFHALPKAHQLLYGQVQVQSDGYLAVHRGLCARFAARYRRADGVNAAH